MIKPGSPRFQVIGRTRYPWEQEAIDFVRAALPDQEPYRAYALFELVLADGTISEIDLLILAPSGLFLVEVKSWPGAVRGDGNYWTRTFEGRDSGLENPRLLANTKAKRLKSRLAQTSALRREVPFIEALVFLSAQNLDARGLDDAGRYGVLLRPRAGQNFATPLPGLAPLWKYQPRPGPRIGHATADKLDKALLEIGILPRQLRRQVGDYVLEELLEDRQGWQDWRAHHVSLASTRRRVRIYSTADALAESRETLRRAAQREMGLLQGISHPGIVVPLNYTENELGPALLFEDSQRSCRFDVYLAEEGDRLNFSQRLHLVRNLAETLDYAHRRHLTHRSLNPRAILVRDCQANEPELAIGHWHAGSRERSRDSTGHSIAATLHPQSLIEGEDEAYLAPEVRTGVDPDGVRADIFSFGALVYRIFTGRAPAASHFELRQRLQEYPHLSLSGQLDGCPEVLEALMAETAHADAKQRFHSMGDVLSALDLLEEELTRPAEPLIDPEQAKKGDLLGPFKVLKRLGRGSTSVVFQVQAVARPGLVDDSGQSARVLKVARTLEHNTILRDEAAVLEKLRHQGVVRLYGVHTLGDRVALEMELAGNRTLAEELRIEGYLSFDFLERFGADLLSILQWLEERGISHRDIKPDNLGIETVGPGSARHLVLFDFSLSRAPLERLELGTPAYLDPFLGQGNRRRYDLAAERYAAAVTLFQMACGRLPSYGDGQSDPAFSRAEIHLEAELFRIPTLRRQLLEFFTKAFARDAQDRYDNAEEMLRGWRRVFQTADVAETAELSEHGLPLALERAERDTGIEDLGLTTRAFHALERLEVRTAGELLEVPVGRLSRMRGVGAQTRQELLAAAKVLRERLAPSASGTPSAAKPAAEPKPVTGAADLAATASDTEPAAELGVRRIDQLAELFFPAAQSLGPTTRAEGLRNWLGLELSEQGRPSPRPTQAELAQLFGITPAGVSLWLKGLRDRWRKQPACTAVRHEIAALLQNRGPMAEDELAAALAVAHGSSVQLGEARRLALGVVRVACEVELLMAKARWTVRRKGALTLLAALREDSSDAEAAAQQATAWALELGALADMLAQLDPLPSPESVLKALRDKAPPAELPPPEDARLVRLAAAASTLAAVSSRRELYPRGMAAERTLLLAAGVAHGLDRIEPAQLRERVRLRYPLAEMLPARPELDRLLERARLDLIWDEEGAVYRPKTPRPQASFTSTASLITRTPTPAPPPETLAAEEFEQRLDRSHRQGGALILLTTPKGALPAQQRLSESFALEERSCDQLLLAAMHEVASEKGVDWQKALEADSHPGSREWANLQRLVELALPKVEKQLLETAGTVLLTSPGLLGRYDQIGLFERLRERLKEPEPGRPLRGLWTLLPSNEQSAGPKLAGKAIPVLGPAEWAWTPESWIQGAHRVAPE